MAYRGEYKGTVYECLRKVSVVLQCGNLEYSGLICEKVVTNGFKRKADSMAYVYSNEDLFSAN